MVVALEKPVVMEDSGAAMIIRRIAFRGLVAFEVFFLKTYDDCKDMRRLEWGGYNFLIRIFTA